MLLALQNSVQTKMIKTDQSSSTTMDGSIGAAFVCVVITVCVHTAAVHV